MPVGSQFAQYINPLLMVLRELGGSAKPAEAKAKVAEYLQLSDDVLEDRLASGSSRFENQVGWARYYLVRSGYLDASRRGVWALTEKGRNAGDLSDDVVGGLIQTVSTEWSSRSKPSVGSAGNDDASPDDVPASHQERLLGTLQALPPAGFERLCQRLLREAGFERVTVTGRSGDGGIDGEGILELNAFVSFRVFFQCKRYRGAVGSPTVRDFRGAMIGRADKGLILTTGHFSTDAQREAIRDGASPIELVDGRKLIELFEQLELGLTPKQTYELDEDFFDEFRD